jgi:diguanylate cyclase (GGDEF)-like protein/PAS domain S-box-containing protein
MDSNKPIINQKSHKAPNEIEDKGHPHSIDELASILDSLFEAVLIVNEGCGVLHANPAAIKILGFDPQRLQLREFQEKVAFSNPDGGLLAVQDLSMTLALQGEKVEERHLILTSIQNRLIHVAEGATPLRDERGEISGAMVTWRDISQQVEAEKKVHLETARSQLMASLTKGIVEAGFEQQIILETITRSIGTTLGDSCLIRLLSHDSNWLEPAARYEPEALGHDMNRQSFKNRRIRADEGPSGEVLQSGRALLISDLSNQADSGHLSKKYQAWLERDSIYSALFLPLRAQRRIFGTLVLLHNKPGTPYTEDDLNFFQELADRAALAIENARLYEIQARRAREMDALHSATSALLTTLDLETLLGKILDAAISAVPAAERGMLHLMEPDTGVLQVRATQGYSDPRISLLSLKKSPGYLVKAMQERRPLLVNGFHQDAIIYYEKDGEPHADVVRSVLVAPLILNDQILGALSLNSSERGAFNAADLRLLVSFAATTTTALNNAMLHSEVQKLALTDPLTQFYNRRGFGEFGQRELERSRRFKRSLTAIMIDVDFFKMVNDTYGHTAGDYVLQVVAKRIRQSVREVDILGRYGGDEFILLLPETDLFSACSVAERIRAEVEKPIQLPESLLRSNLRYNQGIFVQTSASLGVTKASSNMTNLQTLIEHADSAAYQAKGNGRNQVQVG